MHSGELKPGHNQGQQSEDQFTENWVVRLLSNVYFLMNYRNFDSTDDKDNPVKMYCLLVLLLSLHCRVLF